jgi:hypothetical protein
MKIAEITCRPENWRNYSKKSIGAYFYTTKSLDVLVNEKISIYIERGNGNNVIIANKGH